MQGVCVREIGAVLHIRRVYAKGGRATIFSIGTAFLSKLFRLLRSITSLASLPCGFQWLPLYINQDGSQMELWTEFCSIRLHCIIPTSKKGNNRRWFGPQCGLWSCAHVPRGLACLHRVRDCGKHRWVKNHAGRTQRSNTQVGAYTHLPLHPTFKTEKALLSSFKL